MKAGVAAGYLM
ncbi:hypothetical protein MKD33_06635, partial [Chromobacterium piscinae]